ncbi:hypothetical protein [Cetobacterium sp.]|uniref:hypothetical protein n=1 Tax=Cetobacterium sp. TaxID=2071632 RepID=UPI003F383C28
MTTIKNETNYNFSHMILKEYFFKNQKKISNLFFKLDNEEVKKILKTMWNHSYEVGNEENKKELIVKQKFVCNIKKGKFNNSLLYWALELPKPEYTADCKYIGILYNTDSNQAEYITFEKSYNFNTGGWIKGLINKLMGKPKEKSKESYFLGGWADETHLNYGMVEDCNFEEFIEILKGIN